MMSTSLLFKHLLHLILRPIWTNFTTKPLSGSIRMLFQMTPHYFESFWDSSSSSLNHRKRHAPDLLQLPLRGSAATPLEESDQLPPRGSSPSEVTRHAQDNMSAPAQTTPTTRQDSMPAPVQAQSASSLTTPTALSPGHNVSLVRSSPTPQETPETTPSHHDPSLASSVLVQTTLSSTTLPGDTVTSTNTSHNHT